ncbi:LpxL/LpxP family acyltransferase [Candidatus Nitrospira inopinata]|uniref:Lipid A biosynthesis acyltransferase n=1 Tax=Candidatus Nitrospira inopinata TaxID=1715989 RepID=A0A0S4KN52_9BACT|nr:hypothetical protein [Candidatus Nitrospira inopinata]CUQ65183.1 Lipid A biosynthesis acyltransferase [Candidatus Nitrospira inopinata]
MSLAWRRQRERGSRIGIRAMTWVALTLGRPAARALLYPICVYFLLASRTAHRAIARFRERALDRSTGWSDLLRHYYAFAATILDRVYFLRCRFDLFDVRFHGLEALDDGLAKGRGCLLLGAHLGSFEVVRAAGVLRQHLDVRVLMDERNAPLMRGLTRTLNRTVADTVIQAGGVEAMLQVKECLERGGIVGVMGDRATQGDRTIGCTFFGREARFPTGALRLAHLMGSPVVLFFGFYRGGNRYDVHFEPFSDGDRAPRDQQEALLYRDIQRYAGRLEEACRLAPDNWFNFYEFWNEETR